MVRQTMWKALLDSLPRGGGLDEQDWRRRHRLLEWVLVAHVPLLAVIGLALGHTPVTVGLVMIPPLVCLVIGRFLPGRRGPAVAITAGLVYCSTALVGLSGGAIEAHFHFFIIIGFIALYQDWAPFLFNIGFTVLSHGIGSAWQQNLIFAHASGQAHPWLWSLLHGVAVLIACVGMTVFWRVTEDSQEEKKELATQLSDAEIGRRQFTSDLLINLARRNQTMLYKQLDIINQLEETEQDPDALAELFRLDHLATRVRRNAESLLVLSGEQPARVWGQPVQLRDVVRAAIAETEDLDRVAFTVDELTAVTGQCVTDLTHLLAELTENAVRFSPPDTVVTIRSRPTTGPQDGYLLTIEDWGVGMPEGDLAMANSLLAAPPEVDLSVSQRLGFHVVARLAARHGIAVSLNATPGSGITAVIILPGRLIERSWEPSRHALPERVESPVGAGLRAPGGIDTLIRESPSQTMSPLYVGTAEHVGTAESMPGEHVPADRPEEPLPNGSEIRIPGPAVAKAGSDQTWSGWWESLEQEIVDVPTPRSEAPGRPVDLPPYQRLAPPEPYLAVSASVPASIPSQPQRAESQGFGPQRFQSQGFQAQPSQPQQSNQQPFQPQQVELRPNPQLHSVPSGQPARSVPGPERTLPGPADPTVQGLRRRVPQASLAPELRHAAKAEPPPPAAAPSAAAAGALSRYQASRRSAQAIVSERPSTRGGA